MQNHSIAIQDCHDVWSEPYCNHAIPDHKLCFKNNYQNGLCHIPFVDIFIYALNKHTDNLVLRNKAFRNNFPQDIYRNASSMKSGKIKSQ